MKLAQIADKGDDIETLKTLRHKIADTIDQSKSGRDISSLARQLQIVMENIARLEEEKKIEDGDTILDIIRAKHSQRVRSSNGRLPLEEREDA